MSPAEPHQAQHVGRVAQVRAFAKKLRDAKMPIWRAVFVFSTIALGFVLNVPFFGNIIVVLFSIIAAYAVLKIDNQFLEYSFRAYILLFWSIACLNFYYNMDFPIDLSEEEYVNVSIKILKSLSLIMLMLDGFSGVEHADRQVRERDNPLAVAKFGAASCIICAIVIVVSIFPEAKAQMKHVDTFFGSFYISPIWFIILMNGFAIFPLYVFTLNNMRVTKTMGENITTHGYNYVYEICHDFLWYVNIPAVFCSFTLFFLAAILSSSFGVKPEVVEGILSGGICFLVFSAIMIGVHIEHRHRGLQSQHADRARARDGRGRFTRRTT